MKKAASQPPREEQLQLSWARSLRKPPEKNERPVEAARLGGGRREGSFHPQSRAGLAALESKLPRRENGDDYNNLGTYFAGRYEEALYNFFIAI